MELGYHRGKETVESYNKVSVFEMHKKTAGLSRDPTPRFKLGDTWMEFARDPGGYYLKLLYAPPGTFMTAINLAWTKCNYGGHREWFECNKCNGRVGILYRTKDYEFHCRKCLNLNYQSQKMSYGTIAPTMRRLWKYRNTERPEGRAFYRHKMTKRVARYYKLEEQVKMGLMVFEGMYANK
jgi:hypothetical protein